MAGPISTNASATSETSNVIHFGNREKRQLSIELAAAWIDFQATVHGTGTAKLTHTPQGWRVSFPRLRLERGVEIVGVANPGLAPLGIGRRYTDITVLAELRPGTLADAQAAAALGCVPPEYISSYSISFSPYMRKPGSRQQANDPTAKRGTTYVHGHEATSPLPDDASVRLATIRRLATTIATAEPEPEVVSIADKQQRRAVGDRALRSVD